MELQKNDGGYVLIPVVDKWEGQGVSREDNRIHAQALENSHHAHDRE
jgi:hypothetical protein